MKYRYFILLILTFLLVSCEDSPIRSSYRIVLPELPEHWKELLGDAHWRLEWVDEQGSWQRLDLRPGAQPPEFSLINEWIYPVIAWPFWPEWELHPTLMRPCGALFPWDVSGGELILGWKGGVDAILWKELGAASRINAQRSPWNFDWPRFREILSSGNLSEEIIKDPWLADWRDIAGRTVQSGFDSRRIVPRKSSELIIPDLGGRWMGSSPFATPLDVPPEGPLELQVYDSTETLVSAGGILKCSTSGWLFLAR